MSSLGHDLRLQLYDKELLSLEEITPFLEKITDVPTPSFSWSFTTLWQEWQMAQTWLLLKKDQKAGFVCVRSQPSIWEITGLAVLPEFRRQGLMTYLLSELKKHMKKNNVDQLWLETHSENSIACHTYLRNGFKEVGRRPSYYIDGHPAILFTYSNHL